MADPVNKAMILGAPDPAVRPLHVLVADDNEIAQHLLVALLQGAGHRVAVAANGRAAIEAVMHDRFDIILMDVRMPVMDGIQATRYIRALPPPRSDVPIVGLTADASPDAAERYRAAGMDGCLSKSLAPVLLFRAIRDLTAEGRPRRSPCGSMPTLDGSVIDGLSAFLSPDQLAALLTESVVDIEARISRLGARLDAADSVNAGREAHDLVAVAGNCGAGALSALARDIERACRRGLMTDAIASFTRMNRTATTAINAIGTLRDNISNQQA